MKRLKYLWQVITPYVVRYFYYYYYEWMYRSIKHNRYTGRPSPQESGGDSRGLPVGFRQPHSKNHWAGHRDAEALCQMGFCPIALFSLTSASSTIFETSFQPEEMVMWGGVTYRHASENWIHTVGYDSTHGN